MLKHTSVFIANYILLGAAEAYLVFKRSYNGIFKEKQQKRKLHDPWWLMLDIANVDQLTLTTVTCSVMVDARHCKCGSVDSHNCHVFRDG